MLIKEEMFCREWVPEPAPTELQVPTNLEQRTRTSAEQHI